MVFQGTTYEIGDEVKVTYFDEQNEVFKVIYGFIINHTNFFKVAVVTTDNTFMIISKKDIDYIGFA